MSCCWPSGKAKKRRVTPFASEPSLKCSAIDWRKSAVRPSCRKKALPQAPQRRAAPFAPARLALLDAVGQAAAHVVQQQVGEQVDGLVLRARQFL